MKKQILTFGLTTLLFIANAQTAKVPNTRERLASLLEVKDEKALKSSLRNLEKSKEEKDRMLAFAYYDSKGNEEKMEALRQAIILSFPKGQLAYQARIKEISQLQSLEEKDTQFQALLHEKPDAPIAFEMYYVAMGYADKGNLEKMIQSGTLYSELARDRYGNKLDKRKTMADLATALARLNPEAALSLLADGLDLQRKDLMEPEQGETEEIRSQRRARSEMSYYSMLSNYADALIRTGRQAEALQLLSSLRFELQGKRSARNMEYVYVEALLANERYVEALPYLEEAYVKDNMREVNEEDLKKGYAAKHASIDGYQAYKSSLDSTKRENATAQLMKKLISKQAPDFELKDVKGETVRLADLKGKVVVLDFWATWCGPCKASFPAMQKAVNKYKDDADVQFLFIHTWEKGSGDPTLNADKYVTDNKYTFQVLMDLRDVSTKQSAVAKAYGVEGIPAKFIIDPKGQIRFDSGGSSIDEDKAVEELSAMIEFAKKG